MTNAAKKAVPKPLEKHIQTAILHWLYRQPQCMAWRNNNHSWQTKHGAWVNHMGIGHRKGISDILGVWQGKPLAIEVKRPGGRLTPEQKAFLKEFQDKGGIAIVAFCLEDVMKALVSE